MAAPNELLIKINADAKNAAKAFDDVTKRTEDLQDTVNKASLVAGAAFAALSAEVYVATTAFADATASSNALTQALQNQGIFTTQLREDYDAYAAAVAAKTGIDDDQITKAQAIAQGYLGQTEITQELTQAIVDLSTKTGSLDSAATALGKSIGTSTNALAREGVQIRENSTEAERYEQVLRQVSLQYGGQAAAANQANFAIGNLKNTFSDIQEELGERFAPAVRAVVSGLTSVFDYVKNSPVLLDFAAAFVAAGLAVSGLVAAAAPLLAAFVGLNAAAVAFGTTTTVLLGPIGLVLAAVAALTAGAVLLYQNWDKTMNVLQTATAFAVTFVSESFAGLRDVILGAVNLDGKALEAGLYRIAEAADKATTAAAQKYREGNAAIEAEVRASEERQNADKKRFADQQAAEQRAREGREQAALAAANQVKLLQLQQASKEEIELAQERASILKLLVDENNAAIIDAARTRLETLAELEDQRQAIDLEKMREFEEQKRALKAELEAEDPSINTEDNPLLDQQLDALRTQLQTRQEVENQYAVQRMQAKIKADNDYLLNEKKFGAAYALIHRAMHSEIYNGTKQAFGELAQLQQSSNNTLKSIGKAAAIANIIIRTAESAMNIYAGFSTIPIIGPALGVAGAAAAIAFGAEQVGRVNAAATGALVGDTQSAGGTGDRYPFMLERGELVAPARNFDQVVNGVQTERSGIIDELRDRMANLEANGGSGYNIYVQGDFVGDEAYAQRIGRAISDEIEFRNLRFVGVNG